MQADLILKGGRVIDPASDLDAALDVAVADDKIARVGENLSADGAQAIDCSGLLVSPRAD